MGALLSGLHTVCQEANCPNIGECFARGTATFMILGGICTRCCRFCAVAHGIPEPLDPGEPARLADAASALKLKHVVITSVTRDDLLDSGAAHFAACIKALRALKPAPNVEVLVPDFGGDMGAADIVLAARPEVFNHNIETVPRLYADVRPQADYARSIAVLAHARDYAAFHSNILVKSGLMVGLGEEFDEVIVALGDLREAGVDIVTIGQYLRPTLGERHIEMVRYVEPAEFEGYADAARGMGFTGVASSPLVRSSYHADEQLG
jgi:lipoic acid synthetase